MNRKHALAAATALVAIAALVYFYGGSEAPSGQPPLKSLTANNLSEFKNEFNGARAGVRLLLLLSPT